MCREINTKDNRRLKNVYLINWSILLDINKLLSTISSVRLTDTVIWQSIKKRVSELLVACMCA
ncbi:hypothetical protein A3765_20765 [Oleiphilus sp. HI0130]|nr:hypothetical protein A3765_20765 [Oleiphilus sp. HI0130]